MIRDTEGVFDPTSMGIFTWLYMACLHHFLSRVSLQSGYVRDQRLEGKARICKKHCQRGVRQVTRIFPPCMHAWKVSLKLGPTLHMSPQE